jgi:iron(III) transport system permease protein
MLRASIIGVVTLGFFAVFLIYPLLQVLSMSLVGPQGITFEYYILLFQTPGLERILINSINIGLACVLVSTIIALPLAFLTVRYKFKGSALVRLCLFLPLVLPPFVAALGMRRLLARFGPVNLILLDNSIITEPIDFLGQSGIWGVAITQALHLFPILHLNLEAALKSLSPLSEDAAVNLGAKKYTILTKIILPMLQPAFFAGACIVFIAAFSDLGTPLIFQYKDALPVYLFGLLDELQANPLAYCLISVLAVLSLFIFGISNFIVKSSFPISSLNVASVQQKELSGWKTWFVVGLLFILLVIALLPHVGVIILSLSNKWSVSIFPQEISLNNFSEAITHPLTLLGFSNSLILALGCTFLSLIIVLVICWLNRHYPKHIISRILSILVMLPVSIPGLAIALSFLACFSGTWLDPKISALPLLVIGYSLRRLPAMFQAIQAGFVQLDPVLEHAAENLGATPSTVVKKITIPLIMPYILSASILCFVFSVLEVSESLVLAISEANYPFTKALYAILARPDGVGVGSALGVFVMIFLAIALLVSRHLERKRSII